MKEMIFQKKNTIFRMFFYTFIASGALILLIIDIADNKPMYLCYRCFIYYLFITYYLMPIILKYIDIQTEINGSHLNETIK